MRVKSVSTKTIALEIDKSLQAAVISLTDNLREQIKSLYQYKEFMDEHKTWREGKVEFLTRMAKQVEANNNLLYDSAVKVIEKATELKVVIL